MSADDHRALLRDSIRSFLSRHGGRARVRGLRGTLPGYERAHWRELADLGCIGALVPVEQGGVGLTLADMASIMQSLGPGLAPEPVVAVAVGAVGLLALAPESPLASRLLPEIASGALIPSLAWQEEGEELPASSPATRLDADGTLTGSKRFVMPAEGDGFLVSAMRGAAPCLCWIARDAEGVEVAIERRVDGTASGVLTLRAARVPEGDVASGAGLDGAAIARVADECNVCIAAELLGVAGSALAMTLDYLRVREQFGKPLGAFQALQHRAVDLYVHQELAAAALSAALDAQNAASNARSLAASRAKARAAASALAICRAAVQMHGAMGFADECDVGLHLKRALALSAWLGNDAFHRARIQHLLGDPVAPSVEAATPTLAEEAAPADWDVLPDDEFRLRVRAIFERDYPEALRNPPRRLRWLECRDFYRALGARGLLALAWPKQFGGAGLSARKQLIFMQEQDRRGVARAPDMGITMVGPGLIRYGTAEQQRKYLPAILAFDHMWCQGFSEPGSGSDLASLSTQAVRDGNHFVIDGAKVWITFAQDATHMFLLARTDKSVKKQAGISVFLVDLATPGISVRPIRDIAGNEEFCEVRFEGVRVPADALLGPLDGGWDVAKMLLAQERIYLGNPRAPQYALKRLDALAAGLGLAADPVFMARLTQLRLDVWDLATLYERFADQVRRGEPLGPEVSILKLIGSETTQRLSGLALEAAGARGALEGEVQWPGHRDNPMALFMNARPMTIYGGSSEVQRGLLAKSVLDLPGDSR